MPETTKVGIMSVPLSTTDAMWTSSATKFENRQQKLCAIDCPPSFGAPDWGECFARVLSDAQEYGTLKQQLFTLMQYNNNLIKAQAVCEQMQRDKAKHVRVSTATTAAIISQGAETKVPSSCALDSSVVVNGAPDKYDGLHPDPVEQVTDGLANSTELKVPMSHVLGSEIVPNHSANTHKLEKPSSEALVGAMVVDRPNHAHNGLQHSITLGRPPGRSARSDAVLNCTTTDIAATVSQQGGAALLPIATTPSGGAWLHLSTPTATTLSGGAWLRSSIDLKVILLSILQVLSTNLNPCAKFEDTVIITSGHHSSAQDTYITMNSQCLATIFPQTVGAHYCVCSQP